MQDRTPIFHQMNKNGTQKAMAETVRRDSFKNFWSKYSDRCDNTAMMLNHNADELEALDRADILSCLPDLEGKDAVDIGAGIGRFTTVLAQTARHVLSTDFIESFIEKNQQRNAHHGNISYQVGDAVNLQLESNSVDLVFTNWLMMYLNDREVILFLLNALRWLRPNGFLHLRESCSEPSTARSKGTTMHKTSEQNPTSYRFSSLYIKLLNTIRFRDEKGVLYRFDVLWSCSVPTYINKQSNWRQVHWLTKKIRADEHDELCPEFLLKQFSDVWKREQLEWDSILDGEKSCWTDKIFEYALSRADIPKGSTVLAYNPRHLAYHVHINAHFISEKFTCNLWDVETEAYYYRTSLSKANELKDHRVRFSWNQNLASAIQYWHDNGAAFDAFIATELLSTTDDETISKLSSVMKSESPVILLEPIDDEDFCEDTTKQRLSCFRDVQIDDVTEICNGAISAYLRNNHRGEKVPSKKWKLIRASM